MAINVDAVYKTVLLMLNKEQRGYITPDEFNKTATQVQLEIFEQYFNELNQPLSIQQSGIDYANDLNTLDYKISPFKSFAEASYVAENSPVPSHFTLPTQDVYGNTTPFYRLGTVTYTESTNKPVEVQRLQKSEFYNINRSDLTAPSENFPVYLFEDEKLFLSPDSINSNLEINYIRTPNQVQWGFDVGQSLGQYIYDPSISFDFELDASEQTAVIIKILFYAGLIIEDPSIVQAAASEIQQNKINQKR